MAETGFRLPVGQGQALVYGCIDTRFATMAVFMSKVVSFCLVRGNPRASLGQKIRHPAGSDDWRSSGGLTGRGDVNQLNGGAAGQYQGDLQQGCSNLGPFVQIRNQVRDGDIEKAGGREG